MSTKEDRERTALLRGTLDLLILRTLALGSHHGHGIAVAIQHSSQGRKQLVKEASEWRRLAAAMALVLGPELSGG
jgi:hypothetical protein